MANTGKHIVPRKTPAHAHHAAVAHGVVVPEKLSPRVEALRQLVAAGKYQVSTRYLAYKIMRSAGLEPA